MNDEHTKQRNWRWKRKNNSDFTMFANAATRDLMNNQWSVATEGATYQLNCIKIELEVVDMYR